MKSLNVVLYFGANLVPRLSTFVLLLVLTRLLSMDDYGMFALIVVTGEILDMATGGWVRLFVLSSESKDRVPSAGRLGRALVLTVVSCVLSLLGALLLSIVQPSLSGWFTVAVAVYVLAFAVLRLGLTLLQTQQRHLLYASTEIARGVLSLACGVGAVLVIEPTFFSASLGISLVTLVLGLLACAVAFRDLPWPYFPRQGYRAALLFGVPIVSVTLLAQTVGWLDRFILNHALGPASVGLYAAAYALARQPVELFSGSLNPYLFPMLVRSYSSEGREAAGRVQSGNVLTLILLCGAVAAGIALLAQPFAELVLPDAYRAEAVRIMPWIAFATLFASLKNFCFDNAFYITKKNWLQFVSMAPPAVISLLLGLLFIPQGGPVAAAMIAAFASLVSLAGSAFLSTRLLPFSVPWKAIAGLTISFGLASAATLGMRVLLGGQLPLIILFGGTATFMAVYASTLSASGFALVRMLDRPWEIWRGDSVPTATAESVSY